MNKSFNFFLPEASSHLTGSLQNGESNTSYPQLSLDGNLSIQGQFFQVYLPKQQPALPERELGRESMNFVCWPGQKMTNFFIRNMIIRASEGYLLHLLPRDRI